MTDIPDLERRLQLAQKRLDRASAALAPKHQGGEWQEYHAASHDVLVFERQVAAAKGQQYAETLDFPVRWETGAPMPQLMANDYRALLAFLLSTPDPNWDGSYITTKSAQSGQPEPLALVEFDLCKSVRLGAPNDEVFAGHPLHGKGLEAYRAQRVVNSRWLEELESINRVHSQYSHEHWADLNHYVFWFHDSTFECVAREYKVETHRESMRDMLARMALRLIA